MAVSAGGAELGHRGTFNRPLIHDLIDAVIVARSKPGPSDILCMHLAVHAVVAGVTIRESIGA